MPSLLGDVCEKIRSKNAGPYWITVDIFCGGSKRFNTVINALQNEQIAECLQLPVAELRRFDMPELFAIKVSFARPIVQGSAGDRDMHGAQYAVLIAQLALE
ncbi:MAG: DUF4387 family protein [Granulosicoccaceae bacterium]